MPLAIPTSDLKIIIFNNFNLNILVRAAKMICVECVGPEQLKNFVSSNNTKGVCRYCGNDNLAVNSQNLFDYILERVDENVAVEDDLTHFELDMLYECGSDEISVAGIDIVLAEWMELGDEKYFDDLMAYVPNEYFKTESGHEIHFYGDDGTLENNIFDEKWNQFVSGIKYSHRFFNSNAREFLEKLFSFLSTTDGNLKEECVRVVSSGEELYRARAAHSFDDARMMKTDPVTQFGLAPKDKVGNQRMTPNGISALYCAFERQTCLSEIRSITGDKVVSVALTPISQLRLLDLTKLEHVTGPAMTLLDAGRRELVHLHAFVRLLVKRMSRPKGRSDELIYLSSQVVFEFLRLEFASQVHGLVFPSVQTGEKGTNLVLFPEYGAISKSHYTPPDDMETAFGCPLEKTVEEPPTLAYIAGSLRFHEVKAIVTEAEEHNHIGNLYMSDLDRSRQYL